jgi:hypothetical protein
MSPQVESISYKDFARTVKMQRLLLMTLRNVGLAVLVAACVTRITQAAEIDPAALIAETKHRFETRISGGQYMRSSCSPTAADDWPGVELLRCTYRELNTEATVTLALPSAAQLARWTVSACRDAGATDMRACARHIEKRIWSASNAQFPVRGYVIEPHSVLGGASNEAYCFLFRDGVTVRTAAVTSRAPQGGKCAPQSAENDPITRAFTYARIASTTRAELALAPGAPSEADLAGAAFPDAVRKEFVAAWASDRNRLISGAAIADKAKGEFN